MRDPSAPARAARAACAARAAARAALPAAALLMLCAVPGAADSGTDSGTDSEAATGTDGGRDWTAAPRSAGAVRDPGTADARTRFYLEGGPGTVLRDTVAITNEGAAARTYRLRGADAYNRRGGGPGVRDEGASRGAGKWITFADTTVRVPAHTRAEVPFTVTVPEDTPPGDHPAAVVVREDRAGRDAQDAGGGDEPEAGVPVRLQVTGPTLAALGVEHVRVRDGAAGDALEIAYDLVNRGNTALSPRVAVRADGVTGELLRRPARDAGVELLPGERVTLTVPWPDPPVLDSATLTVTATAEDGARAADGGTYTAVPRSGAAALLAVVLASWGGARYARARGRGHRPARRGGPPGHDGAPADGPAPLATATGAAT